MAKDTGNTDEIPGSVPEMGPLRPSQLTDKRRRVFKYLAENEPIRATEIEDEGIASSNYIPQLNRDYPWVLERVEVSDNHTEWKLSEKARELYEIAGLINDHNNVEVPSDTVERGNVKITGGIDGTARPIQTIKERPRKGGGGSGRGEAHAGSGADSGQGGMEPATTDITVALELTEREAFSLIRETDDLELAQKVWNKLIHGER